MSASFLIPYLIAMVLLGSCAALVGALLYRGHRPLGAAIGFAVGIMISPVISDLIVPSSVSSGDPTPAARDRT
jgi:hypothetical protein